MPIRDQSRSRKTYSFFRQQPVPLPTLTTTEIVYVSQPGGDDLLYFDTTRELAAFDDSNPQQLEGRLAYVKSVRDYFIYRRSNSVSSNPMEVVIGVTGFWIRTAWGAIQWKGHLDWFIDPVDGDDNFSGDTPVVSVDSDGILLGPLRTHDEFARRILVLPVENQYVVRLMMSNMSSSIECLHGIDITLINGGGISYESRMLPGSAAAFMANSSSIESIDPVERSIPYLVVPDPLDPFIEVGDNRIDIDRPGEIMLSENTTTEYDPSVSTLNGYEGRQWSYIWDKGDDRWYTGPRPLNLQVPNPGSATLRWSYGAVLNANLGYFYIRIRGTDNNHRYGDPGGGGVSFRGINVINAYDITIDSDGTECKFYNSRLRCDGRLTIEGNHTWFLYSLLGAHELHFSNCEAAFYNCSFRHMDEQNAGGSDVVVYCRAWDSRLDFSGCVFVQAVMQFQNTTSVFALNDIDSNMSMSNNRMLHVSGSVQVGSRLALLNDTTTDLYNMFYVDVPSVSFAGSGSILYSSGSNAPLIIFGPNARVFYDENQAPQLNPFIINTSGSINTPKVWSEMPTSDGHALISVTPAKAFNVTQVDLINIDTYVDG